MTERRSGESSKQGSVPYLWERFSWMPEARETSLNRVNSVAKWLTDITLKD